MHRRVEVFLCLHLNNDFKVCPLAGGRKVPAPTRRRGALCTSPAERRFSLAAVPFMSPYKPHTSSSFLRHTAAHRLPNSWFFSAHGRPVGPSASPGDAVGKGASRGLASSLIMTSSGMFFHTQRWGTNHRNHLRERTFHSEHVLLLPPLLPESSRREFSVSLPVYKEESRHMKRLDVL